VPVPSTQYGLSGKGLLMSPFESHQRPPSCKCQSRDLRIRICDLPLTLDRNMKSPGDSIVPSPDQKGKHMDTNCREYSAGQDSRPSQRSSTQVSQRPVRRWLGTHMCHVSSNHPRFLQPLVMRVFSYANASSPRRPNATDCCHASHCMGMIEEVWPCQLRPEYLKASSYIVA